MKNLSNQDCRRLNKPVLTNRLKLLKWIEGGLIIYNLSSLDVALDPIPYGGATATRRLYMGVCKSLQGGGMVNTVIASYISGFDQWIAKDIDTYGHCQKLAMQGPRSSNEHTAKK